MFFEDKRIENMDSNVDYENLEEYAIERELPFYSEDIASVWNVYAQKYAEEKGMRETSRLSFGYIVSSIFGGMGVSCSTNRYFKEEQIMEECIKELEDWKSFAEENDTSESQIMSIIFKYIFELYMYRIEEYAYKTEKLNIKLSLPMMEQFNCVEGTTKSERFRNLMKHYYK